MINTIRRFACLGLLSWAGFSSCVSTRDITYFQAADQSMDEIVTSIGEKYTPRIQEGNILSITVRSLNKEADEMFNPLIQTSTYVNQTAGTTAPQPIVGFMVDAGGDILLPMIGRVHVKGMASQELALHLKKQLEPLLQSPTVFVRIANYTISVLGEVTRPAVYTIPNERITIPEALALAGDASIYGKRKNILLIRETGEGHEFARIDLTKRDIFTSPHYYLRSGDIIYVEPTPGRLTASDRTIQLTPIIINSLTLLILIFNTFIK